MPNSPHPFAPGDRVVAIDTRKAPLLWDDSRDKNLISTPDGLPREGLVYHVESIMRTKSGYPGVFITGLRGFWGNHDMAWCASRFRKLATLQNHAPKKQSQQQPALRDMAAR